MNSTSPGTQPSKTAELRQNVFSSALSNFTNLLQAGKLKDALVVLSTAACLAEGQEQAQIIEQQARFILTAATKLQRSALHCGNVLPEHVELLQLVLQASLAMQQVARSSNNGMAEITARVLAQTARLGINSGKTTLSGNHLGLTSAAELDELLLQAAILIEESRYLCADFSVERERRLQAARDALSNAIYCLPRFLPGAEYAKAEVYCRHAASLLRQESKSAGTGKTLGECAQALTRCAETLKSGKKAQCREIMQATAKLLQTAG